LLVWGLMRDCEIPNEPMSGRTDRLVMAGQFSTASRTAAAEREVPPQRRTETATQGGVHGMSD
jgi:hypothetical protein